MAEGYSVKLCLCWKQLVLEESTLGLRFRTEESAHHYLELLKTGPALAAAIREAQGLLRAAIVGSVSEQGRLDHLAAAYHVLNRALEGLTDTNQKEEGTDHAH